MCLNDLGSILLLSQDHGRELQQKWGDRDISQKHAGRKNCRQGLTYCSRTADPLSVIAKFKCVALFLIHGMLKDLKQ